MGERRAGPERAAGGWEAWGACRSPSHGVEWGHIRPPRGARGAGCPQLQQRGHSEPHGLLTSARAGAERPRLRRWRGDLTPPRHRRRGGNATGRKLVTARRAPAAEARPQPGRMLPPAGRREDRPPGRGAGAPGDLTPAVSKGLPSDLDMKRRPRGSRILVRPSWATKPGKGRQEEVSGSCSRTKAKGRTGWHFLHTLTGCPSSDILASNSVD